MISNDSIRLSLEGIAFEVGFNDRRSFYNAFKKQNGLSPSEFRNSLR
jgi:AraC-like DNA-binding protein